MERIHARALETENRVRLLETDGMRLSLVHTMLSNISTQATLLLGFALATFGADLLPYVLDDTSSFCVYKDWAHMLVGQCFFMANTCCVSFCMLVVVFSSLLITRSQEAYLHAGGAVSVFRTQTFVGVVYRWALMAGSCFIFACILLMWIFLGLPAFVEHKNQTSGGMLIEGDYVLRESDRVLFRCLDLESEFEHNMRNSFGLWVALLNTIAFVAFIVYGVRYFTYMDRMFMLDTCRGSESVLKEAENARLKAGLRREVAIARYMLRAAQAELRAAEDAADDKAEMLASGMSKLSTPGEDTAEMRSRKAVEAAEKRLATARRRLYENNPGCVARLTHAREDLGQWLLSRKPKKTSAVRLRVPVKLPAARPCAAPPGSTSKPGNTSKRTAFTTGFVTPVGGAAAAGGGQGQQPIVTPPLAKVLGRSGRKVDDETDSTA